MKATNPSVQTDRIHGTRTPTLVLISLLCAQATVYGEPIRVSIPVHGEDRTALVLPGAGAKDAPAPLLLYFHGTGGDENDSLQKRTFHEVWPDATIVYPTGTKLDAGKNGLGWTKRDDYDAQTKDIVFVERLIEKVSTLVRVDRSRIYVTGHSSGGFFAMSLWALRPGMIAASAPVACYGRFESVEVAVKRPIYYVFGLKDTSFDDDPPNRRTGLVRATQTVRQLLARNGLSTTQRTPGAFPTSGKRGSGASIVGWQLHDKGHSWPPELEKRIATFFLRCPSTGAEK